MSEVRTKLSLNNNHSKGSKASNGDDSTVLSEKNLKKIERYFEKRKNSEIEEVKKECDDKL